MRYGVVILPEHPWRHAATLWRAAEDLGFHHAWTYDHLSWRWLRDKPWFGAIPTLAAAATVTSRIELGTLVASPGLRDPAVFAKELMTIDEISGGRAAGGVGAGGYDADLLSARPLTPGEKSARLAEFVELADRLLRRRPVDHDGTYYHCRDLVMQPACARRPRLPLAVAAAGPRGMRLAARFADTWVTSGAPNAFELRHYEEVVPLIKQQVADLERACDRAGRDPRTIGRLLLTGASIDGVLDSAEAFRDASAAFGSVGVTDLVVHWPRAEFPFAADPDTFTEIARGLPAPSDTVGSGT